jgi:uncharacterized membrane protein YhhN
VPLVVRFAPYAVIGVVHLATLFTSWHDGAAVTKPLLMPALLLGFLLSLPLLGSPTKRRIAILAGLAIAFSWIGDVSLGMPGGLGFLFGLGFFFLAHVAYLALFINAISLRRLPRRNWIVVALVALAWWAGFVTILAPHAGALLVPIALYGAVLGGVAVTAVACNRWVMVGALLFLISDSLLGLHLFLPGFHFWQVDFTIMVFYISGQGLIAWGAVMHERRPRATLSGDVHATSP